MGRTKYIVGSVVAAGAMFVLLAPAGAQQPPPSTTTSTTTAEGGESQPGAGVVQGRLSYREGDETVPVEGVDLKVENLDGSFIEDATTDDEGHFEVEVPEPGDYVVVIDPETLPDGVELRGDEVSRQVTVSPGQTVTALFRVSTGGDDGGGKSKWERAPDLFVQGIRFGLVISVCAVGLSLIFGTTGLVNFAHGEMVTFGALVTYFFNQTMGWNLLLSAGLAIVVGGLFGMGLNRGLWRPLRERGTGLVALLVVAIGVAIVLRYTFLYQFGGAPRSFSQYSRQLNIIEIGPVSVVPRELWIIGLSLLILLGVALVLQRTRMGKAIRAVADNKDLAESTGIDVERVISWVWIAGGALAAMGGIFQASGQLVRFDSGNQLLLLMFAAVILGGLGTAYGALVGGLFMGIFIQMSGLIIDTEFKTAAALLLMIVALMIRPQGLLGQAERIG